MNINRSSANQVVSRETLHRSRSCLPDYAGGRLHVNGGRSRNNNEWTYTVVSESSYPPGFEKDIRPLFRPVDIEHMAGAGVHLDQYSYMSVPENAERVYNSIAAKQMPPPSEGYSWPDENVELLQRWIASGYQP